MRALAELDGHLEHPPLGVGHVEGPERRVVEPEAHPRGLRSGLLAPRLHPEAVVARRDGLDLPRRATAAGEQRRAAGERMDGAALELVAVEAPGEGAGHEHRLMGEPLCAVQELLHQQGRRGEHVAHVVEAVAHVVAGKVVGGAGGGAEKVIDGVVVLLAVEPPQGDATRIGEAALGGERVLRPTLERPTLGGGKGAPGRHLARRHAPHRLLQGAEIGPSGGLGGQLREVEPRRGRALAVARHAPRDEDRTHVAGEGRRGDALGRAGRRGGHRPQRRRRHRAQGQGERRRPYRRHAVCPHRP